MSLPIIQFGTSRFLQAHADLMLSEARDAGQDVGPITIVETTGLPASRARVKAFDTGKPIPVRIRGLENGIAVDETVEVRGVVAGISARQDRSRLLDVFMGAGTVISNTGDKGYSVPDAPLPTLEGWTSFPELLTALLRERFRDGGGPITLLPCELTPRNGDVLREIVLALAAQDKDPAFIDWITTRCLFINTLVDRIVSEPLEPVGAVAEPYALWALEAREGFVPPCAHRHMVLVPDLAPFERKKLFILNLAHTLLAQRWMTSGAASDLTVRETMGDPQTRTWLETVITEDVLPAFPDTYDAPAYWAQCRERFLNPYLNHPLAEIAQNHATKIDRRIRGFLQWAGECADNGEVGSRLRTIFSEEESHAD